MLNGKIKLLIKWLMREKKAIYSIYFLALLQGALYMTIPLTIQGIITYTMAGKFSASLLLLSMLTIAVAFFIGILQLWQMRVNETLQENIFCNLTERVANIAGKYSSVKAGLAHFFEVVTLQKGIGKILLEFSFSIISIVFGLLLLPAYSSWFLVFSVVLGIVFFLVVVYFGKKAQEANVNMSGVKYKIFHTLNATEFEKGEIDGELNKYLEYRTEYYKTFEKQYKGILFFKVFFISILLLLGTYLVQIGELNIGQFVASEIIILLVINSVEKLVSSLGTCYDIVTALYKVELLFDKEPNASYLNSDQINSLNASNNIYKPDLAKYKKRIFYALVITIVIILFLPWTQTVNMSGQVTALNPENKPQEVTSRIGGRVEKWFITDGNFVRKNDTIAFISEIKEEYLDSMLVQRSEAQVKSKEVSLKAYEDKVSAINTQIDAINKTLRLKVEQLKNKVVQVKAKLASDSVESLVAINNFKVADDQFKRYEELLSKGVISKTELENRKVKVQEAYAKKVAAENKITATKNDLLNSEIDLNTIIQEYNEKLMKAESDKFQTISMVYEAEGALTKLQNQLAGYTLRNTYYYVLAPQDGYVSNIVVKGVGEIVKEGGILCSIVPPQREQAVELFIDPVDLPLIEKGQTVQLTFDGWPAFVFSGWPGLSYGSFNAKIVSYDKVISPNGKFRILALNEGQKWPEAVHIGGGVKGFALLNNVPVIYELWRKANGFPPEFYKLKKQDKYEMESKK